MRSDTNKCYFEKKNIYYLDFDQGPAEKALLAHHCVLLMFLYY